MRVITIERPGRKPLVVYAALPASRGHYQCVDCGAGSPDPNTIQHEPWCNRLTLPMGTE